MLYSVIVKPHSKKGPLVVPSAPSTVSPASPTASLAPPATSLPTAHSAPSSTPPSISPASSAAPSPFSHPSSSPHSHPSLTVYLREKPVEGEANTALIKLLAEYFHVPKTSITIKSGAHSRQKIIDIYSPHA